MPGPSGSQDDEEDDDPDVIGPLPSSSGKGGEDSEDEEAEEDEVYERNLQKRSKLELQHGSKPVSALCLDPNGVRMGTGGFDYEVALWDFAGMDAMRRVCFSVIIIYSAIYLVLFQV